MPLQYRAPRAAVEEEQEECVPTDLEAFVSARGRKTKISEVRKKINDLGITYIYYQFPSVTGRIMGKSAP